MCGAWGVKRVALYVQTLKALVLTSTKSPLWGFWLLLYDVGLDLELCAAMFIELRQSDFK